MEANDWHHVMIKTMKDGNGFIWENKAGVSWSLWPTVNPLVLKFQMIVHILIFINQLNLKWIPKIIF